jgi:hypothetical protein
MAAAAATQAALIVLTGTPLVGFLPVLVPVPFPGPGGSNPAALNGNLLKKGPTVAAFQMVNKAKRFPVAFERSGAVPALLEL